MPSGRITEELAWLRTVFQVAAAIDIGLTVYVVQPTTPVPMLWVAAPVTAIAVAGTVTIGIRVYDLLERMPTHDSA